MRDSIRFVAIAAVSIVALLAVACGGDGDDSAAAPDSTRDTTPVSVDELCATFEELEITDATEGDVEDPAAYASQLEDLAPRVSDEAVGNGLTVLATVLQRLGNAREEDAFGIMMMALADPDFHEANYQVALFAWEECGIGEGPPQRYDPTAPQDFWDPGTHLEQAYPDATISVSYGVQSEYGGYVSPTIEAGTPDPVEVCETLLAYLDEPANPNDEDFAILVEDASGTLLAVRPAGGTCAAA